MKPEVSIILSGANRTQLLKRTLWSIANHKPTKSFEVVVVDDGSPENVLKELRSFSSVFNWKFIQGSGFGFCEGDLIFSQGSEVMVYDDVYDTLINEFPKEQYGLVFSTTFDLPQEVLDNIGVYGTEFGKRHMDYVQRWPLQTKNYRNDKINYLSLSNRATWEAIGSTDFLSGCRQIPGWTDGKNIVYSDAISLHQHN